MLDGGSGKKDNLPVAAAAYRCPRVLLDDVGPGGHWHAIGGASLRTATGCRF
ncbi:hypothetical protein ACFH04_00650 [Streptomyces noboritoensis]|uniref:Uncharacterized protein n=1 Tax=Streptomyces noboritoensis TaxID=67337 RepID=A0ABV6T8Z7_9ACTN